MDKKEILETYKWVKVKRYVDDETLSWEDRYGRLDKHHIDETTFLIDKVRELVNGMFLNDVLFNEIEDYCKLNELDVSEILNEALRGGFTTVKFGATPVSAKNFLSIPLPLKP